MKEYKDKSAIEIMVKSVLKDFTINKDYIIAGGFVRDMAFGFTAKDIDIFVRGDLPISELDWELITRDPLINIVFTVKDDSEYRPAPVAPFNDYLRVDLESDPASVYTYLYGGARKSAQAEVKDTIQSPRNIIRVEEALYNGVRYFVNFIHCTIDKGFTPENLINTFDYDLTQGYVADDLSLVLPPNFEKACETKTVTVFHNDDPKALDKSQARAENWINRVRLYKQGWKITQAPPKKTLMEKITSPYKEFIKRNGQPSKHEKFTTSSMSLR